MVFLLLNAVLLGVVAVVVWVRRDDVVGRSFFVSRGVVMWFAALAAVGAILSGVAEAIRLAA